MTFVVVNGLHDLEGHACEFAAFMDECLGYVKVDDRDAFVHRIFFFPRRGFHFLESAAHDHFYCVATEAS